MPEDSKTVTDGIREVLNPYSLHSLGNLGSQETAKNLHLKQFALPELFLFIVKLSVKQRPQQNVLSQWEFFDKIDGDREIQILSE